MEIVTIYNINKKDTGVLFALRYGNLVKSINVPFVAVILCQLNSLSQNKDHFNKTTLIFKQLIIVCQLVSTTNIFPRIDKIFKIFH